MLNEKVNILLVDDQPAKLLTYRTILEDVGENLLSANNATEALELLLKHDVAVVLIDVYMPDIDGFQLAAMIRNHPRFEKTALIFISAILLTDVDRLRGYEMGAVDYVPVPVIPEVLRAKVKVFVELFRKTRQLEQLNKGLEARVAERTAELAASTLQLRQSERLRSLALAAGQMGSWEWNVARGTTVWDQGQCEIFGVPSTFVPTLESVQPLINPQDFELLVRAFRKATKESNTFQTEFRVLRPNGEVRWCTGTAAASFNESGRLIWLSGVTADITERKRAEERQILLAEEVDHRARNVVAVVQSIMRLTRADSIEEYIAALDGRIGALSNAHRLLAGSRWEGADLNRLVEEEFAPYRAAGNERVSAQGPIVLLPPATAQTIALALHELATNAGKYGALSSGAGRVKLTWRTKSGQVELVWAEHDGPKITTPSQQGYGSRAIVAGIERQLGGMVNFDWQESGLRCTLCVPYEGNELLKRHPFAPRQIDGVPSQTVASGIDPDEKRVLLVEDEPLVSMMLADMLSAFGHKVDGPYSRFSDAILAAKTNNLQAGILDVNLGGEKTYAVADILANRNIPFAFVTGYGPDSIVSAFSHAPVLQKPIEAAKLHALLQQIVR
jgi:PAS domain S-box-containing protein